VSPLALPGHTEVMSNWGITPRQSIELACARRGREAVIVGCIALLNRAFPKAGTPADRELVADLGGPAAERIVNEGPDGASQYWMRVWAARGLLWVWDDAAVPSILVAMTDEAWRVREMAAKVVARNLVGDLLDDVAALRDDPVPRVHQAATRAVAALA
jgi:hypothetical protein